MHTQEGYWRISVFHTHFVKCPNPLACLGSALCNKTNCPHEHSFAYCGDKHSLKDCVTHKEALQKWGQQA